MEITSFIRPKDTPAGTDKLSSTRALFGYETEAVNFMLTEFD